MQGYRLNSEFLDEPREQQIDTRQTDYLSKMHYDYLLKLERKANHLTNLCIILMLALFSSILTLIYISEF